MNGWAFFSFSMCDQRKKQIIPLLWFIELDIAVKLNSFKLCGKQTKKNNHFNGRNKMNVSSWLQEELTLCVSRARKCMNILIVDCNAGTSNELTHGHYSLTLMLVDFQKIELSIKNCGNLIRIGLFSRIICRILNCVVKLRTPSFHW